MYVVKFRGAGQGVKNAGVILFSRTARFLGARPGLLAAGADAGDGHWLVAPRSTIIQTSPVHSGVHADPAAALAHLFDRLVR